VSTLLRPRPVPGRLVPFLAGAAVIAFALPIFFVAAWNLKGWILGATIWAGSHALSLLLARVRGQVGNLAGSGVLAFGMMFRALAVLVVLVAVAVAEPRVALAGALLYALAYTLELGISLATYFGSPAK
jgi:hypothetical protein